ncbi:flagellar hook-basal body complex protein FliE [Rhizobium sp. CRIBSB]|uniref:Flagellar hook-basal body complex protein FliE n=1 Tax=Peteryoungia aggregata LMG 23059 TaxID=1368425 RepID=A0ABU0G3B5_9HYPH|nr:flagellar hook-basal body complex protein FliE [Peteryoungia aggregata]MDQ0419807.1 flagellar hook-basal body complex protein FliE [Peteryoungia aggregata LMG 23059]NBB48606.1 flagellar hook-basal body complex protein FliE [Rhizobium sp. CRIBSB]
MIESVTKTSALSGINGLESLSSSFSTRGVTTEGTTPGTMTGETFMSALSNVATEAANNLKQAEQTSFDGLMGKANTREVVDAVMQAEQSLQTAIAFRDKIVNAYLEITKMQI